MVVTEVAATEDSAEVTEADSGAVTAAATDFTEEEAVGSTVEAVDTTVATMGTAVATIDTAVPTMGTEVATMDTTADTMGITEDTVDTIGIMGMGTTAAAGGIRGSWALDGVIRGMGMGILITATMIRTILTPATTEIRATTGIRIITTRITMGIMAPPPTATPDILTTDTGMELATAEDITRILLRGIATRAASITADRAHQVMAAHHERVRRFEKSSAVSCFAKLMGSFFRLRRALLRLNFAPLRFFLRHSRFRFALAHETHPMLVCALPHAFGSAFRKGHLCAGAATIRIGRFPWDAT